MMNRKDSINRFAAAAVRAAVCAAAAFSLLTAAHTKVFADPQVIINNEVWTDGDWYYDSDTTIYTEITNSSYVSYESNTYYDYDYSYSYTTTYYPPTTCYTYPVTEYVYVEPVYTYTYPVCSYGEPGLFYDGRTVSASEQIMPCSASRYLTQGEINSLTLKGLCYAKNELFARHGRTFASTELQNYFNGRTWYCGTNRNDDAIYASFNAYEIANVDALAAAERALGMYPVS